MFLEIKHTRPFYAGCITYIKFVQNFFTRSGKGPKKKSPINQSEHYFEVQMTEIGPCFLWVTYWRDEGKILCVIYV